MLTHCRAIAKSNIQTFRGISVYLFDTISSKGELSMHHLLAFQFVLIRVRYSISMTYNESHDLAGSAPNIELTVSKRMPILSRLKLYLAIWVLFMKAHIVPHR